MRLRRSRIRSLPDRPAAVGVLQADALISQITGIPSFELTGWVLISIRDEPDRDVMGIFPSRTGDVAQARRYCEDALRCLKGARRG